MEQELNKWLESTVYEDKGVYRTVYLDDDGFFFHTDPLDFDKDDVNPPEKIWLHECEGWKKEFQEILHSRM